MAKQSIPVMKLPKPNGPYSYGILAGRALYLAGQLPLDATGTVVSDKIEEQTRQVIENLRTVLESAGGGLANVVKTTVFLTDMKEFATMNRVYGEYFQSDPPARSTVQIGPLAKPGARVEIEAIAVLD